MGMPIDWTAFVQQRANRQEHRQQKNRGQDQQRQQTSQQDHQDQQQTNHGHVQDQLGALNGSITNFNDAVNYVDHVRHQFANQLHVYHRFIEILKDHRDGVISVRAVAGRAEGLFRFYGKPELDHGLDGFLPEDVRNEVWMWRDVIYGEGG